MRVIYFLLFAVIYPFVAPFYLDRVSAFDGWCARAGLDDFVGQRSLPVAVLGGDPPSLLEAMKQMARRRDYPRLIQCAEEFYALPRPSDSCEPLCHVISSLATMKIKSIPAFVADLAPVIPENDRPFLLLAQALRLGGSVDQSLIGSAKCSADRYRATALAVGHFPATTAFIRAIENLHAKPSSASCVSLPGGLTVLTKLSKAQLTALLLAIKEDRSQDLLLLAMLDGRVTTGALAREGQRMLEVLLANALVQRECSSERDRDAVLMDRFFRKQFTLTTSSSSNGQGDVGALLERCYDSNSSSSLLASLRLHLQRRGCISPSLTKILIVGEGDFFFTGALKNCLKEERVQIVSSTLEVDVSSILRRYPSAAHGSLIAEAEDTSTDDDSSVLVFNVDACRLQETLVAQLPCPAVFSAVLFTFPYADTHQEEVSSSGKDFDTYYIAKGRHKDLLRGFLQSVRTVLTSRDNRVYIALLLSQVVSWEVELLAEQCGYAIVDIYPFSSDLFAGLGYRRRRTYNSDSFASSSSPHRLMIAAADSQLLSSWRECVEDAFVVELSAVSPLD
eukprot:gene3674-4020_t